MSIDDAMMHTLCNYLPKEKQVCETFCHSCSLSAARRDAAAELDGKNYRILLAIAYYKWSRVPCGLSRKCKVKEER